jgi:hypothetical protein
VTTNIKPAEHQSATIRYKVQYPVSAYTYPSEARIHQARFDDEYIHVDLLDGRILSTPLRWIPTVYNAAPAERLKYEISRDRIMLLWDPDHCNINAEIRIADYLNAGNIPELPAEKS